MLFTFEGGDGAGKTEVVKAVSAALQCDDLHFPNDGGYTGPAIRSYLRREWAVVHPFSGGAGAVDQQLGALAFQALQVANRMEVMPALYNASMTKNGYNLACARYWQSGWVYGQLDGLDPEWLSQIHRCMAPASVNFLLDVDAELAMERRAKRDGDVPPERYEGKLERTRVIIDSYRGLWAAPPTWCRFGQAWEVIDARPALVDVVASVMAIINRTVTAFNNRPEEVTP